ncbi:AbrB family transcriptional regulator [Paracoccus sp. TD-10]|uniref:AbrB family transcriptional regulator n=1 Tax=Paracoccus sp. TD-10 TaxID=3395918 RepID=UPI003AB0C760
MIPADARRPAEGNRPLRLALAYSLAMLAGWISARLHLPLPWMIGPLLTTAALSLSGLVDRPLPVRSRPFGQAVVATTVGLAFTDEALAVVLKMLPLLAGMAAMTTVLALAVSVVQARLAGVRLSRMVLATFPLAPVEAAVIAESCGLPPAPVVVAQSLRIAAIVVLVPALLYAFDGFVRPDTATVAGAEAFDDPRLLVLPLIGLAGGALFRRLGWANPYFLGPLGLAAALTAAGVTLPQYPHVVLAAAQLVLGAWLGSTFQAQMLRAARRELAISMLGTLGLLALTCGSAAALARFTPLDWRSVVLGIAPGGVTEMALTAQFLNQDVSLVTAAHVVRIFLLMPLARPLIRLTERLG